MFYRILPNRHTLTVLACLLVGSSLTTQPSLANEPHATAGDLQVVEPWVRATPPGMKMAAGYMTLINTGDNADALVGATASFADRVELHRTEVVDDVATMRELDAPLAVEPGSSVSLEPGGLHMMFIGVNEMLVAGETVALTLQFAESGELDVEFPVKSMPGKMKKHGGLSQGNMDHGEMKHEHQNQQSGQN